jgi:SulP family sulfate permease
MTGSGSGRSTWGVRAISVSRLATVLAAGVVCGLLAVVLAIGHSTLLARGDLAPFLPVVVGVLLVTAAAMPAVTAYLSTISGQVTTTQEIAVVAATSVVAAVSAAYAGDPSQPAYLATILVSVGLTTVLCGAAMFALGAGGLGRIIRFVPYPVFGGFLAITGWYLFIGGLETVVGQSLNFQRLILIAQDPNALLKVGFAVAFVLIVMLFNRRFGSGALLPLSMVATAILFNAFVWGAGIPFAQLQDAGWIIRVPAEGIAWPPVGAAEFAAIDWYAVGQGLIYAPLVVVVTVAASMMNVSGIEIEIRGELDLNGELRSMGVGNIAAGLLGGTAGFPAVSGTLISVRMGAPHRIVGVIAGVVCLVAVIFAQQLLNTVPAPLLGALLMWLGATLLIDWVIKPLRTLRRQEHAIILIILAVSIAAGFPAGILAGLVAALLLFVFEYSRVDGIRFAATGRDYQSRMLPSSHREMLERIGGSIVIMKLSGFIFFGTSDRIVQRVTNRVVPEAPEAVRFVVMDFRRVAGIDSSTVMSFERLKRLAERHNFVVLLAGISDAIRQRLRAGGLDLAQLPLRVEPDLDTAVAWAERSLLAEAAAAPAASAALARHLGSEALADQLRPYCDRVTFPEGANLIEQGASADDIFFIDAGEGHVMLEAEHGDALKLMAFGPGTILGEVAFYLSHRRSASAIATTEVTAYRLSRGRLADIERDAPALAAAFHYEIARALADRLQSANRLIQILAD